MQTMKRKKSNILTLLTKTTFCFVFVFLFQSTAYAVKSFDNIFSLEEPKPEAKNQLIVNALTEEDFGESEDFGNYEGSTFDGPYNVWSNTVVNPYNQNLQNTKDSVFVNVSSYHHPLAKPGYITSHFGPRHYRYHYGTDLKLETGDTVRAAFDGMVRISKVGVGYGNYVLIRHNNGFETVYGHLSKLLVDTEQKVKAGDPIGLGGSTGHSTGPHLHFEVRYLGNPINPEDVIDFQSERVREPEYLVCAKTFKYKNDIVARNSRNSGSNGGGYYTVKRGDTLSGIAKKKGVAIKKLCRLNGLRTNAPLSVGKKIRCS